MTETVPWSEYLQKSIHYNGINSTKEPVRVMLSSIKNGLPKVQSMVFNSLLSTDQRVLIFTGATRNADLMSVVKSPNATHVIYMEMPKTKETYIITGRIYIVAAPALSYRFGTPPRRINIKSDMSAEEFWEEERVRIWQKIPSDYRASFTWPEPGIPCVNQIGGGEESWSVYNDSNTIKLQAVSNIDIVYRLKTFDAIKKDGKLMPRYYDSEYKILSKIDSIFKGNSNATGKITLFTERKCCDSCTDVIAQFSEKYPNMEVEIVHNNDIIIN